MCDLCSTTYLNHCHKCYSRFERCLRIIIADCITTAKDHNKMKNQDGHRSARETFRMLKNVPMEHLEMDPWSTDAPIEFCVHFSWTFERKFHQYFIWYGMEIARMSVPAISALTEIVVRRYAKYLCRMNNWMHRRVQWRLCYTWHDAALVWLAPW